MNFPTQTKNLRKCKILYIQKFIHVRYSVLTKICCGVQIKCRERCIMLTETNSTYFYRLELSSNRSSHREVFSKKVFLEILQKSQENTCAKVCFLKKLQATVKVSFLIKLQAKTCKFIKKETLIQVFSCEFCKNSKNTFSYRTPPVAASVVIFFFCRNNSARRR